MLKALSEALAAIAARTLRARGHSRRQWSGLLRRARSQGDRRAPQGRRSRPRLFRAHHGAMQSGDAADRGFAAAGHCRRSRHRHCGGLPAGGKLRSRDCLARRKICYSRRQYRSVLFDADGGAHAQRIAQARDGNALDR